MADRTAGDDAVSEGAGTMHLKIFERRIGVRRSYVVGGAVALFLAAASFVALVAWGPSTDQGPMYSALWFVALLSCVVTTLTFTSVVFAGLRLENAVESFGMPPGSIRALLAIGIMVLLVVFGLPVIQSFEGCHWCRADTPATEITVRYDSPEELAREMARLYDQGIIAIVVDSGRVPAAPETERTAKVRVLQSKPPKEYFDLSNQILTAIVTLLTTVVGFYFGSRSSSEGSREPATKPLPPISGDLTSAQKQLSDALAALSPETQQALANHDAAKSATLPDDEANRLKVQGLAGPLADTRKAVEEAKSAAEKALAQAKEHLDSLAVETKDDARRLQEASAKEAQSIAKQNLDQLRSHLAIFNQQIETFNALTASG